MRDLSTFCCLNTLCRTTESGIVLDVRIDTTLDVICRIITQERQSTKGRRYGHPVIDIARELNRYMHPQVRYAGRDRQATKEIREALAKKLRTALHGPDETRP